MKKKVANPLEQDPEALEAHIEQLEKRFERLKAVYEAFFAGIEKQVPAVQRREMNRLLVQAQQIAISKAALRFRFQTLMQRWVTYTAHWNRILREIEQGTYRRDLAKLQRHLADAGGQITEAQAIAMGVPPTRARAFVARQNRMVTERGGKPSGAHKASVETSPAPATAQAALPGVSSDQLKQFYDDYNRARAAIGDTRPCKPLAELAQKLRPQIEKVLAESRASMARIEVTVEDGKVRVLARPQS